MIARIAEPREHAGDGRQRRFPGETDAKSRVEQAIKRWATEGGMRSRRWPSTMAV